MPRGTTLRNIRINDDLWTAAQAEAAARGEDVSTAVRRALEQYTSRDVSHGPDVDPESLRADSPRE